MTSASPRPSHAGRFAEMALWSSAALVVLTAHISAAAVLLRQEPAPPAENGPPAAIMIELAAEPEAANTEEDQVATEEVDSMEVASKQLEPVEEPPPEPLPEPVEPPPPEEIAEPVEPEPEPVEPEPVEEPEPEPEITETIPEPPPEPVEEVDPLEQQMIAALENVEVPLPVSRPPPPPEPKKEPPKRVRKQPQASKAAQQAKLQTKQSDRTAATQTTTGSSKPSVSPAKWKSRVQSKIARNARRCPGNDTGTAAVRFSFDGSGNITSVSLSRSSGNSAIDNYIVAAVRRASPIPAPPAGVPSYLDQGLRCE
ncbi:energy transducer TonB [Pseudorhizobium endolithicum]|uniref:Energy transducer TonB n=1 Tax=Pseudorhizobium endolithicum TaxID=1191678 RepID=A0ABN7JGM2_9HYPH|nr:TonB family protein [Pseudorhizobium endolithicum]CAD7030319.1 energy transducer TonB [Pseudorhizobium endolithicum]